MSTPEPITATQDARTFHGMVGMTPQMRAVFDRIELLARTRIPVLVEGETGTGKEMVVRALLACSGASPRMVDLNCAAIPGELVESELFGHERGAFTGAIRRHAGILEQANGGVLFLDEVSELPVPAQAKLLRAIETGEYRAVGGERLLRSCFRLVAATNETLSAAVAQGRFRRDLFHRLGSARILLPPLRARRGDIKLLAETFLATFLDLHGGGGPRRLGTSALQALRRADWPGNVRELRHVVEAAAAICPGGSIRESHIEAVMHGGGGADASPTLHESVREAERRAIREALERADGRREVAARQLGISVATLYRRLSILAEGGE